MTAFHHIRRQRWRLATGSRESGFAMRSLLRNELETLNHVFEHALDAVCPDDAVVHIPKLELHLRITDASQLFEQLSLALAEQLGPGTTLAKAADNSSSTLPQQRRHDLLHYLRHGRLAWHALSSDAPTSRHDLAQELSVCLADATIARTSLRAAVPDAPEAALAFCLRLLNLLPDATTLESVRHALMDDGPHTASAEHQHLVQVITQYATRTHDRYQRRYLEALHLLVLSARQAIDIDALATLCAPVLGSGFAQQLQIRTARKSTLSNKPSLADDSAPSVTATGRAAMHRLSPDGAHDAVNQAASTTPFITPTVFASPHSAADAAAPGLRVHAAGLILLHPYLPRFFEACHIERDKHDAAGRIVAASLPRAAALLHRLATNREDIHEFELGLIKPLLGLPIDAPLLVAPGLLGAADLDECTSLLDAVVEHWSVLRSTSATGLRISFLQRHGLLYDSSGHWQLHVEAEAFDILLARLPWSISLIKLPWMTKPIFTDWPTH